MRLRKTVIALIIIFTFFQNIFSQENRNPVLISAFGRPCSEELMARYDGFMGAVHNEPSSIGYIIFYGDKSVEGKNLNYIRYMTEFYPQMRQFDKTKILLLRGENQTEMKVQFWVVPAGAVPPKPDKSFIEEKFTSTALFDKSWADFNNYYFNSHRGKLDIYADGFLDLGCDFSPNVAAFAKTLISKTELTGYLIVYTEFGKSAKRGNQIVNFALRDLIRNYKVPRNRIKAIYGGNREGPEIEFWFLPKGDVPPKPVPDKKP
jgi:hypothetical protein